MSKASTDDQLTRYLLGELPEGESAALEEEYFGDDACFERLLALEDELIDDYVRGALPATRHAQLDRRLRETGQWRRVQFARALSQRFGANSQTPRTAATRVVIPLLRRRAEVFVGALAAALLLFAVAAGWFSLRNAALRGELARAEELQRSLVKRSEELQRSLDAEQAQKEAALRQLNQAHAEGKTSKPARFLLLGTVRAASQTASTCHLRSTRWFSSRQARRFRIPSTGERCEPRLGNPCSKLVCSPRHLRRKGRPWPSKCRAACLLQGGTF